MFGKERAQQERIDTNNPEVKWDMIKGVAIRFASDAIKELFFEEKTDKQPETFASRISRYRADAENFYDINNQEIFLHGCREYEDRIDGEPDPAKKESLQKDLNDYKKEWEKQKRREMEDRELRAKKIALRQQMRK